MLINMFFCENNKLHSNRTIDFTGISIDYNYPTSKKNTENCLLRNQWRTGSGLSLFLPEVVGFPFII